MIPSEEKPNFHKHWFSSFVFAWRGITAFVLREKNARIHLFAAVLVLLSAWYFKVTLIEWCVLLLCIALVIITEMVNTSIELIVDKVYPDIHPKAARIKDIAAGAVLIASGVAAIVGGIIFVPYIINLI